MLAIVVEALIRIGRRALKSRLLVSLAGLGFAGIYFFALPFPLIVVVSALVGFVVAKRAPQQLALSDPGTIEVPAGNGRWRHFAIACAIGLVLWWAPVALAALTLGPHHVLVSIGLFFSKLAVVTFGGAYAVLAYMAQQVVETHGWLSAPEMVDALGLAETTPGPLILVTQFVGYLAAFREAAPFTPLAAGLLGVAMTTWVTFVPAMLWIFAGAPFIEELRGNRRLGRRAAAITAAVVGVILNLSVWFRVAALFGSVTRRITVRCAGTLSIRRRSTRMSRCSLSPPGRWCSDSIAA